jgi:hypothetical protein
VFGANSSPGVLTVEDTLSGEGVLPAFTYRVEDLFS